MKTIFVLIVICLIATQSRAKDEKKDIDLHTTESLREFKDENSIDGPEMRLKREETPLENSESNDELATSSFVRLSTPLIVMFAVLIYLTIPFNAWVN